MTYDPKLLKAASDELKADAKRREDKRQALQDTIYLKLPRVREIDRELKKTGVALAKEALLSGSDATAAIKKLKHENYALQAERAEILVGAGYAYDCIDDVPLCSKCGDTGYIGAKVCECLDRYYRKEQTKELTSLLNLNDRTFEKFSLDVYSDVPDQQKGISPRKNMELVLSVCRDYANNFKTSTSNLFLNGGTGLGKTFMSACIAKRVSEMGFSVVYDTAINIIERFESEKFGRDWAPDARNDIKRYLNCDLLIVDDLGTETFTGFVNTALYTLIETRLNARKKTVINSNLTMDEMRKRYSPQIMSRLEGEYIVLPFFGKDLRLSKQKKL